MSKKSVDRREEAREKARQLRVAQERREKRNRALMIGGIVLLLVLVAFVVWMIVANGSRSAVEQLSEDQVPANTEAGGIPVGSALAAGTDNGDATRIDIYYDYTCTYCLMFEDQYSEYLDEVAQDGTATVVYRPVGLLDNTGDFSGYSGRSASAAGTVAEGDPQNFLAAHAALVGMGQAYVDSQGQNEADAATMAAELEAAGVDPEVAQRASSGEYAAWVEASTEQFGRDGYQGTPTILVDGEQLENWSQPGALQDAVTAAQQ